MLVQVNYFYHETMGKSLTHLNLYLVRVYP